MAKLNTLIDNLVLENDVTYRLYADLHCLRSTIMQNKTNRTDQRALEKINCFSKLIEDVKHRKQIVYGEHILKEFDDHKETALLVSHCLSLSGAPVVLLNFAIVLKKMGYHVLMISPEEGPLVSHLCKHSLPLIVDHDLLHSNDIGRYADLFSEIVVNTIVCAPVIRVLENETKVRAIWWIHESRKAYTRLSALQMPRLLSKRTRVCCVGAYAQRILKHKAPFYRTELLNYYEPDLKNRKRARSLSRSNKTVFATIGSIEQRKGQDVLMDAISVLPGHIRSECIFIIVGKIFEKSLREKIVNTQRKYPEQLRFIEELDLEEIYDLYDEIDYLICSSRDDPMPVTVTDAFIFGKPCICSINTGSAKLIERYNAGFTYSNNNTAELAEKIADAYSISKERYIELAQNSRRIYEENFTEEVFEKNVKMLIGC